MAVATPVKFTSGYKKSKVKKSVLGEKEHATIKAVFKATVDRNTEFAWSSNIATYDQFFRNRDSIGKSLFRLADKGFVIIKFDKNSQRNLYRLSAAGKKAV